MGISDRATRVRDAALVSYPRDGVRVLSNRGVAGIDGTVSTAVGAALAYPQGRTVALMGDLTFLPDASGLLTGPAAPRPPVTCDDPAMIGGGGAATCLGLPRDGGGRRGAARRGGRVCGETPLVGGVAPARRQVRTGRCE